MKKIFFFAFLLATHAGFAQVIKKIPGKVVVMDPPVKAVPKKSDGKLKLENPDNLKGTYKVNPGLQMFLAALPSVKTKIGGTGISTKLYSEAGITMKRVAPSAKPKDKGVTNDGQSICHSYSIKLSPESETFDAPLAEKMDNLYPGAVYDYYKWMTDNVSPQPIKSPRNPIILQLSASSANGKMKLVSNPTSTELQAAAGALKATMPGKAPNISTDITVNSIVNEASFALNIEAGGGGFGFSAQGKFGITSNTRKTYLSIDAKQKSYTIQATLPEDSAYGFFKDAAVNGKSENLIISSVTYGRRVIGVIETEFANEGQEIAFQAKASALGFSGNFGLGILNGSQMGKSTVKLLFIGGGGGMIEIPNPTEQSVMEKINTWMRSATSTEMVPISFTFRNMKNEGMRWESSTDNINYQQCVPAPPKEKPVVYKVTATLMSIENSKQENVKLGLEQYVKFYANNNWLNVSTVPFLCWMELPGAIRDLKKAEEPRSFTNQTTIKRDVSINIPQTDIFDGNAYVELYTDYIAMYATKIAGSTNDMNPKRSEKIYLKDVVNSKDGGGSVDKQIDINLNGRVFTLRFQIMATPIR